MTTTPVAAPVFNWDILPAASVPQYTRNRPKDVEKTTPEAIKVRVRESFDAYKPAPDGGNKNAVTLSWRTQDCGSEAMAKEFLRLAKRYAAGAEPEMTLRGSISADAPTVVRFMAKPFEAKIAATVPPTTEAATEAATEETPVPAAEAVKPVKAAK